MLLNAVLNKRQMAGLHLKCKKNVHVCYFTKKETIITIHYRIYSHYL
jgi:hypothetical protein